MYVHALEADRGRVEVEVNAPEGRSKGVGEAGPALVVQRVGLAKDHGRWRIRRALCENGVVLGDVGVNRTCGHGVVHQRALEGYAW